MLWESSHGIYLLADLIMILTNPRWQRLTDLVLHLVVVKKTVEADVTP